MSLLRTKFVVLAFSFMITANILTTLAIIDLKRNVLTRERMENKAAASVIHLEKNKVVAQWLQLIDQTL